VNTAGDYQEDEDERSLRYWKAAISCLSTPEKREAAEEFLRTKLEGGRGADTLFALILLLEANGAFLLKLPERFHVELIEPLSETLNGFCSEWQAHVESRRQAAHSIGIAHDQIEIASRTIRQTNTEFEAKIRAALCEINVTEVANQVSSAIESSTLRPMQATLRDLNERTAKMERAAATAEKSIETWRKVHLGGIVANCLAGALIFALLLVFGVLGQVRANYRQKLAAEIHRLGANDEALQKLIALGIDLRVAPWELDSDGKPVRDGYAVIIERAEHVKLRETDGRKQAVAFVKDRSVQKRIDELREDLKDIRKALPAQ
jgi:hypothetical protein